MDATAQRSIAQGLLNEFLYEHLASKPAHTTPFVPEAPRWRDSIEVARDDVVERYLSLHPEHEPYRQELVESLPLPRYSLARERWEPVPRL